MGQRQCDRRGFGRAVGGSVAAALSGVPLTGCIGPNGGRDELIVYSALDREFSEPVLERFSEQTGVAVRMTFDVESTKTVGLTQRLLAESARPRCDLFWNNEILNTLRLQRAGLLRPLEVPDIERYPAQYRSSTNHWFGFAARARVLLVNHQKLAEADFPASVEELAEEAWRSRCGVAKPLFGTTATHAACLFALWGPGRAERFWTRLLDTAQVLGGNKQVAQAVGAGQLDCGLTDTDDALAEVAARRPVTIVFPDQQEGALGTLFIPNTLAALAGRPREQLQQELVSYLLSAEVEIALAQGPSGQIPLQRELADVARVETPWTVRAMEVDFERAADAWDQTARVLERQLGGV